jgi:hypothetical protein
MTRDRPLRTSTLRKDCTVPAASLFIEQGFSPKRVHNRERQAAFRARQKARIAEVEGLLETVQGAPLGGAAEEGRA